LLLAGRAAGEAGRERERSAPAPWAHLGKSSRELVGPEAALLQGAAVAATLALVESGADDWVQQRLQESNPLGRGYADAAYLAGFVAPVVVAGGLYWSGRRAEDATLTRAGAAACQSLGLALLVSGGAKLISGRRGPIKTDCGLFCADPAQRAQRADDFDLAFWRRDLPWELFWPSGHAAATAAVVASQQALFPERRWIAWVGYGGMGLIGIGLVEGDYHWLSDVAAGLLIGHAVGGAVGRSFGDAPTAPPEVAAAARALELRPALLARGGVGLSAVFRF